MGKQGIRKINLIIPYTSNEDEITSCFEYGIDMAYIFCTKSEKAAVTAFKERIATEYKLKKAVIKVMKGNTLIEKVKEMHKVVASQAKQKKLMVKIVLSSSEHSGAALLTKYFLPNVKVIFYDNKIITLPFFSEESQDAFESQLSNILGKEPLKGAVLAHKDIEAANNVDVISEKNPLAQITTSFNNGGGKNILCENGYMLAAAFYNKKACPVYSENGELFALDLKKADTYLPKEKMAIINAIGADLVSNPLETLGPKVNLDPNKVGRHLKGISDEGMVTIDGAKDTVEISDLGKFFLS